MRLTKIYTKIGDSGETLLANGAKIKKSSTRIEAYGTIDELNSFVGFLKDTIRETIEDKQNIDSMLYQIQNELFDIGGELATPAEIFNPEKQQCINELSIKRLEDQIDGFNAQIKPLENFILPGGHKAVSAAHIARTVCRRAEVILVRFIEEENQCRPILQKYINRLSDWLFVAGRVITKESGSEEILWNQNKKK